MSRGIRRFGLTAHVVTSVGWFGAVAAFLALAVVGLISPEPPVVRAAYIGLALTGWLVIVPLAIGSLVTGIIQSVGTAWGLVRQWWVVAKLVITVPATVLLLVHMGPINHVAGVAAADELLGNDLAPLRLHFVAQAGAALVVLL
ncbi:MAG: hypothetical protein ACRDFR_05050, partial [Candidatus Limnocylindria bacterium]